MARPEIRIRPRQAIWLTLVLVFATTAIIQVRLAVEMKESWALWVAGVLAFAAAGCGVAVRQTR